MTLSVLDLRDFQRLVRHRSSAEQIFSVSLHRLARHGGRMVARRFAGDGNLAEQVARLARRLDRSRIERRLSRDCDRRSGLGAGDSLARVGLHTIGLPDETVARLVSHSGWRILMLFGAVPALLTFFIRLFVPESERWLHETRQRSNVALGHARSHRRSGGNVRAARHDLSLGKRLLDGHPAPRLGSRIARGALGLPLSRVAIFGTGRRRTQGISWRPQTRHRPDADRSGSQRHGAAGNVGLDSIGPKLGQKDRRRRRRERATAATRAWLPTPPRTRRSPRASARFSEPFSRRPSARK